MIAMHSCVNAHLLFETFLEGEGSESPEDRLDARAMLLRKTEEACREFLEGNLSAFDPSVGDQACQIRALQFSLLSREDRFDEVSELKKRCGEELSKLDEVRALFAKLEEERDLEIEDSRKGPLNQFVIENDKISEEMAVALEGLKDQAYRDTEAIYIRRFKEVNRKKKPILERIASLKRTCAAEKAALLRGLDIRVDGFALTVIGAYLLTCTREQELREDQNGKQYSEKTNVHKLESAGFQLNTKILSRVLDAAKKALAASSICFVQSEAKYLNSQGSDRLRELVAKPRAIPRKGRNELPFFYLTRVVFERAVERGVPVLLKVRNVDDDPLDNNSYVCRILFHPISGEYQVASEEFDEKNQPLGGIVIQAFSRASAAELKSGEFRREMLEIAGGLLGLINLNAVQHTQYTDQGEVSEGMFDAIPDLLAEEKTALQGLMKKAIDEGFSNEKPAVCCIDHIFCGRMN